MPSDVRRAECTGLGERTTRLLRLHRFVLLSMMVACGERSSTDPADTGPLETRTWKSSSREERAEQVDALLGDRAIIGMSRDELEAYLGPPDARTNSEELRVYFYYTGGVSSARNLRPSRTVLIYFDEAWVVVSSDAL